MHKRSVLIFTCAAALAAAAGAAFAHTGAIRPGSHCHAAALHHRVHYARSRSHLEHYRFARSGRVEDRYAEGGIGEWREDGAYRQEHGDFREDEHAWSHTYGDAWSDDGGERPSAYDEYGYLTWPGKTHFGPPPGRAGEPPAGPPDGDDAHRGPPPGADAPYEGPPPPPEDGYEVHRF